MDKKIELYNETLEEHDKKTRNTKVITDAIVEYISDIKKVPKEEIMKQVADIISANPNVSLIEIMDTFFYEERKKEDEKARGGRQ